MGARSVTGRTPGQPSAQPSKQPASWKLAPPHDKQTQGIVVSGFGDLPSAQALFLMCDWPDEPAAAGPARKGAWLQALTMVAPITDSDGKDDRAASIAFTWTGLQKSGLDLNALASFSAPFREGMYQEDRLRRLGDRIKGKWQGTVINGGPQWSGNTPVKDDRPPAVVRLPAEPIMRASPHRWSCVDGAGRCRCGHGQPERLGDHAPCRGHARRAGHRP